VSPLEKEFDDKQIITTIYCKMYKNHIDGEEERRNRGE
jgi:hypothetical protein